MWDLKKNLNGEVVPTSYLSLLQVKNRSTRATSPHVLSKPTHIGFKIYAKAHKEAGMYAERYMGQGSVWIQGQLSFGRFFYPIKFWSKADRKLLFC